MTDATLICAVVFQTLQLGYLIWRRERPVLTPKITVNPPQVPPVVIPKEEILTDVLAAIEGTRPKVQHTVLNGVGVKCSKCQRHVARFNAHEDGTIACHSCEAPCQ